MRETTRYYDVELDAVARLLAREWGLTPTIHEDSGGRWLVLEVGSEGHTLWIDGEYQCWDATLHDTELDVVCDHHQGPSTDAFTSMGEVADWVAELLLLRHDPSGAPCDFWDDQPETWEVREHLLDWLVSMDPNGCYDDEEALATWGRIHTLAEARAIALRLLSDQPVATREGA